MENRIQIDNVEPLAYKGMFALGNYLSTTEILPIHMHLLKIRASQINACAYCVNMHTKEGLKDGESQERIFLLNAWKEAEVFTEEEKIVLQLSEEVTLIHNNGLSDATYKKAIAAFGENYFSQLIMAIVTINAWNRIAVSTRKPLDS